MFNLLVIANEGEISQQPGEDYKLARQIVCTIHDNIPANIFEPQILMTIGENFKSVAWGI